jgi:DNA-binding NarL/FixJ family response regulator
MDVSIFGPRDGVETALALRARRPGLPIVFLSAFSDPTTSARVQGTRPVAHLTKPFDASSLEHTLRAVFESAA